MDARLSLWSYASAHSPMETREFTSLMALFLKYTPRFRTYIESGEDGIFMNLLPYLPEKTYQHTETLCIKESAVEDSPCRRTRVEGCDAPFNGPFNLPALRHLEWAASNTYPLSWSNFRCPKLQSVAFKSESCRCKLPEILGALPQYPVLHFLHLDIEIILSAPSAHPNRTTHPGIRTLSIGAGHRSGRFSVELK